MARRHLFSSDEVDTFSSKRVLPGLRMGLLAQGSTCPRGCSVLLAQGSTSRINVPARLQHWQRWVTWNMYIAL